MNVCGDLELNFVLSQFLHKNGHLSFLSFFFFSSVDPKLEFFLIFESYIFHCLIVFMNMKYIFDYR